jgi:hypothetical protein
MIRSLPIAMLVCGALTTSAAAQTATHNLPISGGPGFTGTLGGNITANVKLQSSGGSQLTFGHLHVQDLDIAAVSGGGFGNLFPNSVSHDGQGAALIAIAPTTIGVNIPTAPFGSTVGGAVSLTAGDHLANAAVGAIDPGVAGSDGAWDDPGQTGMLNDGTLNAFQVGLHNPINATTNVSGQIAAAFPSNVTIPNVINSSNLKVDVVVKNSSSLVIDFDDVQNLSIQNLTLASAEPIPLAFEHSNFNEATHPSGYPQADLSALGLGLVQTTVSGTLVANLTGTLAGSIDLRANVNIANLFTLPIDFDDAIHGVLSQGPLVSLDQPLNANVELPFAIAVLHEPTADVDFDDVAASLRSGTLGLELPLSYSELDMVVPLPATPFEVTNQFFPIDQGPLFNGTIWLQRLKAELGGQLVLDLNANFALSADLVADALAASLINVTANPVPEPSTLVLATAGMLVALIRFPRQRVC